MKTKIIKVLALTSIALASFTFTACSDGDVETDPNTVTTPEAVENGTLPTEFCLFPTQPAASVSYTLVKKIKAKNGTYGSTNAAVPKAVTIAQKKGANAIMNFKTAQKFSIFPWRFMTPVATGKGIFISNTNGMSCQEMGGQTVNWYMNH